MNPWIHAARYALAATSIASAMVTEPATRTQASSAYQTGTTNPNDTARRSAALDPLLTATCNPRHALLLSGAALDRATPACPTPQEQDPRLLNSRIADIIVRVRGGAVCTGTPITGTALVVTAAHCVLDRDGRVSDTRTVLRDGVQHTATAVLVNLDYHRTPHPGLDVAILVMDEIIPGPSAILGNEPTHGVVTLAGFQPLDTDGSLLRGTRVDNRPLPNGATGPIVRIDSAAAGCVLDRAALTVTPTHMTAPCGLIPGASGGGLFVESGNDILLIGVISTVADNLTSNGVAPAISIHELLTDPATYRHEMRRDPSGTSRAHINRS